MGSVDTGNAAQEEQWKKLQQTLTICKIITVLLCIPAAIYILAGPSKRVDQAKEAGDLQKAVDAVRTAKIVTVIGAVIGILAIAAHFSMG